MVDAGPVEGVTLVLPWEADVERVPDASEEREGGTQRTAGSLTRLIEELAAAPSLSTAEGPGGQPPRVPPGVAGAAPGGPERGELGPGHRLGRFVIVRLLGRGGFGAVYEAEDPELRRRVAIKVIRPRWRGRPSASLRQEAEAVARLQHPAIVTLHDFGREGEELFLVYELLHGETLEARLARGRLAPAEAFRVLGEMARALAHAHASGVVHRDLKPANVFLTADGGVKVLDFGLSLVAGSDGLAAGTPPYVAPEQWRGERADARADVYAWGMVGAVLLGEPLPGEATPDGLAIHRPDALRAIAVRARAPDPARRPPDGAALLEALARMAERRRRLRGAAWAGAAFAAVALVFLLRPTPRPALPPGPFRLAVADAENASGDPALDGLGSLVAGQLEGTPLLAVLDRTRLLAVLRATGRTTGERLDAEAAALAARQAGASALLVPAAVRDGEGYALTAVARRPSNGEELFRVREVAAAADGLLPAVARMARAALAALREREPEVRSPEAEQARLVTSSLEAHRRYFQGLVCMDHPSRAGGSEFYAACAHHFREALEIDPDFPLAWFALARAAFWEGRSTEELLALLGPALRLRDRLPPPDQAQLDAWKAFLDGDEARVDAILAAAAAAYPEDAQLTQVRGDLLFRSGRYAEAAPALRAAWELDPGLEVALDELVWVLGTRDRQAELRALLDRLARARPSTGTLLAEAQARGWLGEHEAAVAAARRAAADGNSTARETLVAALAAAGRIAEAEREARAIPVTTPFQRRLLGQLLRLQGREQEARPIVERPVPPGADPNVRFIEGLRRATRLAAQRDAPALARLARQVKDYSPQLAATLAPTLAYAGDVEGALALRPALDEGPGALAMLDALVAWRREGPAAALPALRRLARSEPRAPIGILPPEGPSWLAAECAVEAGEGEAALADLRWFQRYLYPVGPWRAWALPRSYVLEARVLAGLGRRAEALSALDRLEALWKRADPGQPLLAEARALRARLKAGTKN